jgi:hypothetical protein
MGKNWQAEKPLRFVLRKGQRILQQLWVLPGLNTYDEIVWMEEEWRDVPLVDLDK